MTPETDVSHAQLARVVRQHTGQLAASLVRVTGDFATAEVGLPRFDGQGWWLGQATCVRASLRVVVSNSSGVM
jgi:hypothetical protein